MKFFVIAILACGIGSPSRAADNPADTSGSTHGLSNGRFWVSMEHSLDQEGIPLAKVAFVSGVSDALSDAARDDYYSYLGKGMTAHETIDALDAFYKVPENLRVPIVWALSVVSLRAKGGSAAEVDALTAKCRKRAAE